MNQLAKTTTFQPASNGEDGACAFCRHDSSVFRRMVAANRTAEAFLSIQPVVPGHTLIVPKRCVARVDQLEGNEIFDLFELRSDVASLLSKALRAEGFNFAWNEGEISGQTVPHFHLHVVPRKAGDIGVLGYDPRSFFYRPGPRENSVIDELERLAVTIRCANTAPVSVIGKTM